MASIAVPETLDRRRVCRSDASAAAQPRRSVEVRRRRTRREDGRSVAAENPRSSVVCVLLVDDDVARVAIGAELGAEVLASTVDLEPVARRSERDVALTDPAVRGCRVSGARDGFDSAMP